MKSRRLLKTAAATVVIALCALSVARCSGDSPTEANRALAEELQRTLDTELQRYGGIGASAAVSMPGGGVWIGASGNSYPDARVTSDMVFGIGSVTKAFVATVILQLAEQGALNLDDSLFHWLPAFAHVDGKITIRQLLGHTGGVYNFTEHPDHIDHIFADLTRVWTPEETIATLTLAPYGPPGSSYHYSNTGYLLLGLIIRESTGSLVASEIRNRISAPLGLTGTFLSVEEAVQGEVVHGWHDLNGNGSPDDLSHYPRTSANSMHWTAGAMYSTAEDLVTFLRALVEGKLLQPASLDQMLDFGSALPNVDYGLGVSSIRDFVGGTPGVGHDGGTYGYSARMVYLPDYGVYLSVLLNYLDEDGMEVVSRALARVAIDHLE